MKILVAAPRLPFPLDKGDRLTVFHFLRYFSQRHEVSLACFQEPDQDTAWQEHFAPFCERIEIVPLRRSRAYASCLTGVLGKTPLQVRYFADSQMKKTIRRMVGDLQPDLLYAQLIRMGQHIEPHSDIARVVAFNLSMSLNYRRLRDHTSNLAKKLFYGMEYSKLKSFEADFARRFDRVLLISPYDFDAIHQDTPLENVFFCPHGVDHDYFTADPQAVREANSMILTGNMSYAPNVDAALYFCRDIFALVHRQLPNAKLTIAGADPTPEVRNLAQDPLVEVTGRVPDLRPIVNRAQVGVAPIRIAAGLQNKVLEGMSMRLPMVVTPAANEAIQAVDEEHLLIAESPERFADAIVRLLTSPKRRTELGRAARRFIVEGWTWEAHYSKLETMFESLVAAKRRGAADSSASGSTGGP
ncbi:MAG: glycosyltransferase [Gemmatimonadetes bacterium]|nr:MAG: glycosyltransferase [Gemmatimonadota bacterium]